MNPSRALWRATTTACAAAWAWVMVALGLVSLTEWSGAFPLTRGLFGIGGVMLIAAGEFVFAALVADRVFPRASRRLTGGFELAAGVCVAVAAVLGVFW